MILRENILATIAYYDFFDFPLKAGEILKYLINFKHLDQSSDIANQKVQIGEIKKELDQLILDGIIGLRENHYFLYDREFLVPLRLKREATAKHKWQKTKKAVRWLRLIPFTQAIFASGSLAINNTDELSDLDVLIVVKHGKIWLSRILILGMLSMLGLRRKRTDIIAPNKICPNHFITEHSLNIPFKSIYTAQIYSNLVPIFLRKDDLVQEFKKENGWVLDFVYSWNIKNYPLLKSELATTCTRIAEIILSIKLGAWLENLARNYQSKKIMKNKTSFQGKGRIKFNDKYLEFHPNSIETRVIRIYNERLRSLGLFKLAVEKDSGLDNIISEE